MDPIMHDRLARQEQRRAARMSRTEDARRLARLEVQVDALHGQVARDSLLLGTAKAAAPGVITRETRLSDEVTCTALAERNWDPAERLAIAALMPAPELEPAMADVRSCGKCGWSGTGGSCWCPRRPS